MARRDARSGRGEGGVLCEHCPVLQDFERLSESLPKHLKSCDELSLRAQQLVQVQGMWLEALDKLLRLRKEEILDQLKFREAIARFRMQIILAILGAAGTGGALTMILQHIMK